MTERPRGRSTAASTPGSFTGRRHSEPDLSTALTAGDAPTPATPGESLAPRPFDAARAEAFELFHITPRTNLEAISAGGIVEGDGRHWKGARQHAVYLTDRDGVSSWLKELRRRGAYPPEARFAVLGVDGGQLPLAALERSGHLHRAITRHGLQARLGIRGAGRWVPESDAFTAVPPGAFEYLGDL